MTVIGVVGDIRHGGRGEQRPAPDIYLPILQSVARNPPVLNLLIRCTVPPATVIPAAIRELRQVAPDLPAYDIKTMDERLAGQTVTRRFFTGLMVASALLALLLSVVGTYGVISCMVSQRIREMGIRMSLGATAADLIGLVVGQGFRLALAGVSLGIVATLVFSRLAGGFLQGFEPPGFALFGGASALLVGLVVIASYLPVRRVLKARELAALVRGVLSK
jgi:predicted lysophospholipase L1 biosynthesis ABC-type transport system permease subunit